ncbi:hypothetical protein SO694_00109070 [Aureococcus anophagefferens]|uniref:J domain-containing protein n=1 Tax=Aureococcus anophagefferens TaxID=44056 RepID=A0ABR1FM54_AURAN
MKIESRLAGRGRKWFDGVGKDDRVHAAIARAGGLFSLYLTAAAVQICKDNKRQTISPQDVVVALKSPTDKDFVAECAGFLERDREQRPKHAPTLKKYRGVYQGSINACLEKNGCPRAAGRGRRSRAHRAGGRRAPRRRGVWKASLVAVAVVFGVAAVGWSRQGGDDFEFQLVGFDDDFDTGLPGGAWGEKLYECKNGEPTVPKEYKKGDWGSIAGDWLVPADEVRAPGQGRPRMNQEMMYTSEGTNYWWNYTGNYQLDDYKGVWKNEDGDGTNTDMYALLELPVTITRKGIPWILKESYEYDKKFEKLVKKAMVAAGVLKDGGAYYYKQEASCDYTWFHTGDDAASAFAACGNIEDEFKVIKKAYHRKILVAHPDKGGDAATFREVNASFEVLRGYFDKKKVDSFAVEKDTRDFDFDAGGGLRGRRPRPEGGFKSWDFYYEASNWDVPTYRVEPARSDRSNRVWEGLPADGDAAAFEAALARMNEVTICGVSELNDADRWAFVAHCMDKSTWAKLTKRRAPPPAGAAAAAAAAPRRRRRRRAAAGAAVVAAASTSSCRGPRTPSRPTASRARPAS